MVPDWIPGQGWARASVPGADLGSPAAALVSLRSTSPPPRAPRGVAAAGGVWAGPRGPRKAGAGDSEEEEAEGTNGPRHLRAVPAPGLRTQLGTEATSLVTAANEARAWCPPRTHPAHPQWSCDGRHYVNYCLQLTAETRRRSPSAGLTVHKAFTAQPGAAPSSSMSGACCVPVSPCPHTCPHAHVCVFVFS